MLYNAAMWMFFLVAVSTVSYGTGMGDLSQDRFDNGVITDRSVILSSAEAELRADITKVNEKHARWKAKNAKHWCLYGANSNAVIESADNQWFLSFRSKANLVMIVQMRCHWMPGKRRAWIHLRPMILT